MEKHTIQRSLLTFASILFLLCSYAVVLVPHSFAEQQLVCPTPAGKSGSMKMSNCYVVDSTDPSKSLGAPNQDNTLGGGNSNLSPNSSSSSSANTGAAFPTSDPSQLMNGLGGSGAGGLFSNLPILNFLLPAGQPAAATSGSSIGLSPLSQLLGASQNTTLVGNSNGTFSSQPVNGSSSSNSSSNGSSSSSAGTGASNTTGSTNTSLGDLASRVGAGSGGNINGPGGSICQPDALENGSCKCPSYQETNFICKDEQCAADGGLDFSGLLGNNLPGMPPGANCAFSAKNGPPKNGELECVLACNSKPIIYLYPTKTTSVDVEVAMEGHVTVSDPHYTLKGWQNVIAEPNGELTYGGRKYRELYYESETIELPVPKSGLFLSKANLRSELQTIGKKLGLNAFENDEFTSYWTYRLQQVDTPYIFFSIYEESEKVKVDDVQISPKPDTFIGFLAYFKPVEEPYTVEPFHFPSIPPRKGFTAVEWGGTLDE